MDQPNRSGREPELSQLHPWYRYPWPWVAIAIPAIAVVGGLFTLYLAVTNPDPLVLDEQHYQDLRSELRADPDAPAYPPAPVSGRDDDDGDL